MNSLYKSKRSVCLGLVTSKLTLLLTFLCLVIWPIAAAASDIAARSCLAADIQAAINTSKTGDRVLVPAGTCVWNTTVGVSGKNITIQGAGKTATIITIPDGGWRLDLSTTSSRVTGFGFLNAGLGSPPTVQVEGQNWRVDHNRFEATGGTFVNGVWAYGARAGAHPTGVIDHNEFVNARVLVYGDGLNNWSSPSTIGSSNQTGVVYVEDNSFNFTLYGNAMDSQLTARYVFRYNSVTNTQVDAHSNQGTRNARSWEIYNNTFHSNRGWYAPMFIRGGTGVVFNNTITGDYNFTISIDNVRSHTDMGGGNGKCDGSSPWDGNVSNGRPCRDQIGRGQDAAGPFPQPQASEPAYFWNNTMGGGPTNPRVVNCESTLKPLGSCADIQLNRDYYNSSRPGYTPYTYPHPLVSATSTAGSTDTTAPTPGNSGLIASTVNTSAATLNWVKGTDDISLQPALQYEVRLSTTNDIGTVVNAETFGAIVKPYTADINSAVVPGWAPGTTYFFNVIVKDGAGNKSAYTTVGITMPLADAIPPVPGNSGLMTSSVTPSSATLGWTKATDNSSLQSLLQYEVRRSSSNNIDSVAGAEANGVIVQAYASDVAASNVVGLSPSSTYYFNVIVRDVLGNKAAYLAKNVTTASIPDTTAPISGNSGAISTGNVTSNGLTLNWTKASDNVTSQAQLVYEVRRSSSNNIGSVPNAEANGAVVQAYTADLSSATLTGLSASATYYFNVIVKDAAGNKGIYLTKAATTSAGQDTTAPVPGNGGTLISSSLGSSSLTLSWARAADDVSVPSQLMYEVRRSTNNNVDTVLHADAYGTIVQAFTADIASVNLTGLTSNTTYYFNVIVKDAAGNRSSYLMKSVTTATSVDTAAPTPGNSGTITASIIGTNGLTLNWTKATDSTSPASDLQYEVRRSLSNNIETVARAEANGIIALAYSQDIATANISGLAASTSYFFNVIVKDEAGNKAVYAPVSATTVGDTIAPVPGGSGLITSNTTSSSMTFNWVKATDNTSLQAALRYEVRLSSSNNIATVTSAETNGTIGVPYKADSTSAVLSGLTSGTDYYVTVIVKDEANNKAVYQVKSETTNGKTTMQVNPNGKSPQRKSEDSSGSQGAASAQGGDITAPAPGAAGLVTMSGVSSNGLTLRWTSATDNVSPKPSLQYEVIQSAKQNINTVAEAEANGTAILDFTADATSHTVKGLKNALQHFFTVVVKDDAGNKAVYGTAGNLSEEYSFPANAGVSRKTVSALSSPLKVSQVQITPVQGSVAPSGMAIVRSSSANGVMSAAAFPLSGGVRGGTLYANVSEATAKSDGVRTGVSMANPSSADVEIAFSFTDANGIELKTGVYVLLANRQISAFLDESPFNGPSAFSGMFTFSSSAPISATGTRTVMQNDGEFLLQTLPIAFDQGPATASSQLLPLFVDGTGWSTEVVLMNRSMTLQTGTVQFWGQGSGTEAGSVVEMTVNGVSGATFNYSVPPHSIVRLATAGTSTSVRSGSVRVTSYSGNPGSVPDALAIVSSREGGSTVSEASVSALPTGTAFRSYVEISKSPEWVSTSLAIVNASNIPNTVNIELTRLDGTRIGWTSLTLPPSGQTGVFVMDLFPNITEGFKGLLRLTASNPVAFASLRCMYNAEGQFMITSTPALNEAVTLPSTGLAFPLVASGAGYDTELVLFGRSGQAGEGEMLIVSRDGVPQTTSSLGVTP